MAADKTLSAALRSTRRRSLALAIAVFVGVTLILHRTTEVPTRIIGSLSPYRVNTNSSVADDCAHLDALARYLCQHDVQPSPSEALFVTIADWQYVDAVRVFAASLQQAQEAKPRLLAVCMDLECHRALESYGIMAYTGYVDSLGSGATKASVAELKFMLNIDLVSANYNFIFFDGDVFVHPGKDPLAGMLQLSDNSWDLQLQSDGRLPVEEGGLANIGWYWMRPSAAMAAFLQECLANWRKTRHWDQAVFNHILNMTRTRDPDTIRAMSVSRSQYINFMHEWWTRASGDEKRIAAMRKKATVLHLTCVERAVKMYLAKYFGFWADLDGYYTRPTLLLAMPDLRGSLLTVAQQLVAGLHIAHATGRIMIMPEWIHVEDEQGNLTLPSYQLFHTDGISHRVVESRFTRNQMHHGAKPAKELVMARTSLSETLNDAVEAAAAPTIRLGSLDFDTSDMSTQDLKLCSEWRLYKVDVARPGCMKVCGDAIDVKSAVTKMR